MPSRKNEYERRLRQFEHYLDLMRHRARDQADGDCFIILSALFRTHIDLPFGIDARFAQFAFAVDNFKIDIPNTTLLPGEAKKLIQERNGFRMDCEGDAEREFTPVRASYKYTQIRKAAEDTAYLFFDLYCLPLDVWIEIKAFSDDNCWEDGFTMN